MRSFGKSVYMDITYIQTYIHDRLAKSNLHAYLKTYLIYLFRHILTTRFTDRTSFFILKKKL